MKELIYFVHGNGFPALCYRQFLQVLSSQYDCRYLDRLGHNPDYPVTDNWTYLVDEVLFDIQKQCDRPVIAVGHSLGAVLNFFAAIQKPECFKAVIMLDAPLFNSFKCFLVAVAKKLHVIDTFTPASKTKGRRAHWKTEAEVLAYLQSRPLFKNFTNACLMDYIHYGLEQDEDGFHLRFDRDIEYAIYRTIPHTSPQYQGKLHIPTALIYGDKSDVVTRMDRLYMTRRFGMKIHSINGTHLFPFEIPEKAGEAVIRVVRELL